jgi:DNA-binding NtrC family response regulator
LLRAYGWPGNVRELENVIERAVALEQTPVVLPETLPAYVQSPAVSSAMLVPPPASAGAPAGAR